jgi:PAS domain S-box-containing protein
VTAVAVTVLGRTEFAVFAAAYFLNQVPILVVALALVRLTRNSGQGVPGQTERTMSQRATPWCERDTAPDQAVGESVHSSDDRSHLLHLLDDRLRFEKLLSRLSATFIHLPADKVDSQIEHGLEQIVEFLQIERSGLAQLSEDGSQLTTTHSYWVPGYASLPPVNLAGLFPWYAAKIREGEVLRFSRLPDDLPAEAVAEKQYCIREGMRSQLTIPFKVGDAIIGGIGFGSFRRHRDWPDDLVQSLQLVAEVFANALARKRAELVLRESEGRFRRMADTAPVMVWMSGADKGCTYFNKPWLDFTGQPVERQLGDGWSKGVHADDLQRCLDTYVQAFDARREFRMEYRLQRFDGEYRWILDTGVPRFESDGTFEGYIGSCIDITDEKAAEEELRNLREQLVRVGRVTTMGELAASIAHEVNQPLCAIISNAQAAQRMLAEGDVDIDEVREALADIMQDGQRASAVIARIRGYFQKVSGERSRVDFNNLIREVVALMRHDLAMRGVKVRLDLAEPLPPVQGDRVQLQQVVMNLMANAADAMDRVAKDWRQLVIRSIADGTSTVVVAVQDTGVGLDSRDSERIFDAFFTTKPGGMGMGLAICKSIIQAHGGRIWASPNAGQGATVQFTLPGMDEATHGGR